MRRAPLLLVLSLTATPAMAQEAPGGEPAPAPLPSIPPPPPPPPPAPPAEPPPPSREPLFGQPPPSAPSHEIVYVEEPRRPRREPIERQEARNEGFSFGIDLNSFQRDFGFGARLTSPNLAHFIRLSAGGGMSWVPDGLPIGQKTDTWEAYYYGRLTLELTGPQLGPVRTYAFAGAALIGVPSDLSSTEINIGGLGGFGFEFLISRFSSYCIELGALGSGATADQLVNSPSIANGFLISVGSRFYP